VLAAIAIVTGGAYEEGLSAAESLLRAGATVSIWDEGADKLQRAAEELGAQGFKPDLQEVDVANWAEVQRAYEHVRGTLGPVDALVNFATLKNTFLLGEHDQRAADPPPFWEVDVYRALRTIDVNALGTYLCSRAVAGDMVQRRRGSMVNFSTSEHTQRSASHIPYGPTKALVEAFSLAAAEQLKPFGVRVNVISSSGRVNRRGQSDPGAQPSDWMAPMLEYFLSDASAGVTGQVLSADEFTAPAK